VTGAPAGPRSSPQQGLLIEPAAAKVNLTLDIKGKRADGYHELESLVVFADFGDRVEFRPSANVSLTVEGPFAAKLDAGRNLVERAAMAFAQHLGQDPRGAFHLIKQLPVAAGLGGGSADAAAALRLLRRAHGAPEDLASLVPAARDLGADVPSCLYARAALMTGIGEKLQPLSSLRPMPAVLVNPMVPLATRDVFHALAAPSLSETPPASPAPQLTGLEDVVAYARARRNALEEPAKKLLPLIGDVLSILEDAPGSCLARLSGSGPTCFALFPDMAAAEATADRIAGRHPDWWVQPVQLS